MITLEPLWGVFPNWNSDLGKSKGVSANFLNGSSNVKSGPKAVVWEEDVPIIRAGAVWIPRRANAAPPPYWPADRRSMSDANC